MGNSQPGASFTVTGSAFEAHPATMGWGCKRGVQVKAGPMQAAGCVRVVSLWHSHAFHEPSLCSVCVCDASIPGGSCSPAREAHVEAPVRTADDSGS